MSFIYVISSETNTNLCKIGLSKSPESRLKQLQTGHPDKLKIHYLREIDESKVYEMEKLIHDTLKFYKERNKWFNISVDNAKLELDFHFIRYEDVI